MFKKFVIAFVRLMLCSSCFAEGGMPDANDWFIQQLTSGGPTDCKMQISHSYAVWQPHEDAVKYYDGTGIYELLYAGKPCSSPSLSGSSIVCLAMGGILHYSQGYKRLIPTNQSYAISPDVYGNRVVWAAGPNYNQLNVYYNDGFSTTCLTNNPQCFHNGFDPQIALNSIAWLSFDGNDNEVFILENGVIRQLTHNDINENELSMSDNGHLAWSSCSITRPASLASGATTEWANILETLFNVDPATGIAGALEIGSNVPLHIAARTFNQTTTGTYRQFYPAITDSTALSSGQVGVLPLLKKNSSFRTNVGALNLSNASTTVLIKLFSAAGSPIGSTTSLTLDPYQWAQANDIFPTSGAGNQEIAYATVELQTSSAKAWFYAAVVDNATGDPTTVVMTR